MGAGEVQLQQVGHRTEGFHQRDEVLGTLGRKRDVEQTPQSFPTELLKLGEGRVGSDIAESDRVPEGAGLRFADNRPRIACRRHHLEAFGGDHVDGGNLLVEVLDQTRLGRRHAADGGQQHASGISSQNLHHLHTAVSPVSLRKAPRHWSTQSSGTGALFHGWVRPLEELIRTKVMS